MDDMLDKQAIFRAQVGDAVALLKAMANPERLWILCQLGDGDLSAGELQATSHLSQSAFSQHLARLRADNLVSTRRDRTTIYYKIADPAVLSLIDRLQDIYCPEIKNGQD